jgi:HK97 family phage portal protein
VSRIAASVAAVDWHLFRGKGENATEIDKHPLIDLLNKVNTFQTRYDLFEQSTIYQDLVGESFWILNFNRGGLPGEIWMAPPQCMHIVPDSTKYIRGYVYRIGTTQIPFAPEEVVHIKWFNPYNQYRGLGPAQAIGTDLSSEKYAAEWNRNFFYNSAVPGALLIYPENVPDTELERIKEQWNVQYRGVDKAHKLGILSGKPEFKITMPTQKDMEFEKLRKMNRDNILGAFGMPTSIMGVEDVGSRARAEADEYIFSKRVVLPRLIRFREAINEQLCPLFGDDIEVDFDDPVPENQELNLMIAKQGKDARILTANEARELLGFDPIEGGDELDELPPPPGAFGNNQEDNDEKQMQRRTQKAKTLNDEQKEAHWRTFADHAELYEKTLIEKMRAMFGFQQARALVRLSHGDKKLITIKEARQEYKDAAAPVLRELLKISIQDGQNLVHPEPQHRSIDPMIWAERWLRTRMGWAAEQIGEETANLLAEVLAQGYAAGEGIPDLTKRVERIFVECDKVRATRIARTETIMASNEGALTGYGELGVEKAEFYAAIDERACDDCLALHKEIFTLNDSHGMIPLHPQCRCVWLPVIE